MLCTYTTLVGDAAWINPMHVECIRSAPNDTSKVTFVSGETITIERKPLNLAKDIDFYLEKVYHTVDDDDD